MTTDDTPHRAPSASPFPALSASFVRQEARRLGFFACGLARAEAVDAVAADAYRRWIARGGHADMHYLADNLEKRLDPTLLLSGAQSIVVCALNYAPARRQPAETYQLAAYAYGQDYHDVLKKRLRQLAQVLHSAAVSAAGGLPTAPISAPPAPHVTATAPASEPSAQPAFKLATDTVPLLERYWAQRAGIGFIGRNHLLVIPHAGSMFFLGEIITNLAFDHYDQPMASRCGTCRRCLDACPTGALADGVWGAFDSRKCLSYQTIENRGDIDERLKPKLGTTIYGCDRCQQACPWNRFATATEVEEFAPDGALLAMTRADWQSLSVDTYRTLFKGSAVKRAKYEGLMRNIRAVSDNDRAAGDHTHAAGDSSRAADDSDRTADAPDRTADAPDVQPTAPPTGV